MLWSAFDAHLLCKRGLILKLVMMISQMSRNSWDKKNRLRSKARGIKWSFKLQRILNSNGKETQGISCFYHIGIKGITLQYEGDHVKQNQTVCPAVVSMRFCMKSIPFHPLPPLTPNCITVHFSFRQLHHLHLRPSSSNSKLTIRAKKCASLEVKKKSKPTVKDQKMHRSIFAKGGIPDGTQVAYISKGEKVLHGYKQGRGIFCLCCNKEISPSQFEVHAGRADRKKPYENIFVSNGVSLHAYSSHLKLTGKHLVTKNDDMCGICNEGGDLLPCDGCPRSFHEECIPETRAPFEKWFCKYCQVSMKCLGPIFKYVVGGTVSGIKPIEEVVNRCVRIIENSNKHDLVACVLCRSYDFNEDGFSDQTVIVCDQCELEFHIGCLREHYLANLKALPPGSWFCSVACGRLNYVIKVLVTCGAQKVPDSLVDNITNLDVKWIIIHGKYASEENKLLLTEAVEIFHDGFNPIIDLQSGKDFIDAMTYGKSIEASDFAGVHSAILTTNSKVVTAGLFRVFGHEIVELPIVATSRPHQGKGYFKLFFTCFEKLLSFLKIKKLVIPAAEEAKAMWINKFGFKKVTPMEVCVLSYDILVSPIFNTVVLIRFWVQKSEYRQKQTSMVAFSGTCLLERVIHEGAITFEDNTFFSLDMV
ncbi:hypothetical protein E3N88_24586 [Mikania micrantha]|uniref:PHD-type domain-containing protein n=1 Tax=Mikania micrantha TaxID=192012 RepID=A0A5N6N585_9ASTR|nr:hypothetical protein E3N88_24586 [Mikania micrantha]